MKQILHFTGKSILGFFMLALVGFYVNGQANLAENKTIVASDYDSITPAPPGQAVDGSTSTFWAAQTYPQWLEVDLGAVYGINKTELVCHKNRDYQFFVEAKATSGGSYDTVVDRTSNTTPGAIDAPITDSFASFNARYVKITVTGAATYTGDFISLREFRVFGDTLYTLTVNSGSGDGDYTAGTVVNISADAPPANEIFDQWTGDVDSIADVNDSVTTITMPAGAANITATYKDASKILFYDDCEDNAGWNDSDWSPAGVNKGNSISVVTEQKRAGERSYRYILVPGAATNVELVLRAIKDAGNHSNFIIGQEYWIGYSMLIPKWYNYESFWTSPQFHLAPDACDSDARNPNVGFFLEQDHSYTISIGGEANACTPNNSKKRKLRSQPLKIGVWNDVVFNVKFNYDSSGFFRIWVNDSLLSDSGPNCDNDAKGPYMKVGIYAHPNENMTVYYDEIRVGNANASYDDVAPKGEAPVMGVIQRYTALQMSIYPNPSTSGNFTIEYQLQKASDAIVTIFDEAGNTMKTFVNKNEGAGMRTIEVDAVDYTPGMYFCKVVAGDKMVVKKFIIQ